MEPRQVYIKMESRILQQGGSIIRSGYLHVPTHEQDSDRQSGTNFNPKVTII